MGDTEGEVDVQLQMTIEVLVTEGEDIAHEPLFPMLGQIGLTVADALRQLRIYMV